MTGIPQIFDEALVAARARRATEPFFLSAEMEARLLDRLEDVTREFESVGMRHEAWRNNTFSHPKIKNLNFLSYASGLTPHAHDLIISMWELGTINDVPGYLSRIKQCLKPDGWFLAVFYGGETLYELRQVLMQADNEFWGGAAPRVAPMIDLRDAAGLLQRAGFALPVADSEVVTVEYDNLFALMRDLRRVGWANALTDRRRTFTPRRYFMRAAEIYAETYGTSAGKIPVSIEAIFLSAWAPAETQQRAMIPGTATQRLADALNATEHRV